MTIVVAVCSIILFIYVLVILRFVFAFAAIEPFSTARPSSVSVTVIIPYRNEEQNIERIISQVMKQKFDVSMLQVVAVNDHSSDTSQNAVEKLSAEFPNLLNLSLKNSFGKKAAITEGVAHAKGQLIVTLDADMEVVNTWLNAIANYFRASHKEMIILPVMFNKEENYFDHWQTLEFLSLIGSTFSTAQMKMPVMCNGANLAFTREAFIRVNGFDGNHSISSGDDMFLLFKIKKENKNRIGYLLSDEVVAKTKSCASVNEFIKQRVRWASKAGNYRDSDALILAALVWVANFSILAIAFHFLFLIRDVQWIPLSLLLAKMLVDFIFIARVGSFFSKESSLKYYPWLAIVYPFYAVLIPLVGIFYRPKWKGRSISLGRSHYKSAQEN